MQECKRVVKSDFIPDRSRPGKTMTVTSDWALRVTGGHATWIQRRGGKQRRRRKERNEESKKDQVEDCYIKCWNHDR